MDVNVDPNILLGVVGGREGSTGREGGIFESVVANGSGRSILESICC